MGKSGAASNVIDLEAFRQRKMQERASETATMRHDAAVFVPVWFCWVPVWAPALR